MLLGDHFEDIHGYKHYSSKIYQKEKNKVSVDSNEILRHFVGLDFLKTVVYLPKTDFKDLASMLQGKKIKERFGKGPTF